MTVWDPNLLSVQGKCIMCEGTYSLSRPPKIFLLLWHQGLYSLLLPVPLLVVVLRSPLEHTWSLCFSFHLYKSSFFCFFKIFWYGPFLKSLLNLFQYCFYFMFWFFGCKACGILAPRPGVKPVSPALESKVLTTGPPGKSHMLSFLILSKSIENHDLFLLWFDNSKDHFLHPTLAP